MSAGEHGPREDSARFRRAGRPLPPEIQEIIDAVVQATGLDFAEGRADVEAELRAHFEDGLDRGVAAEQLIARFGDPVAAGQRIARTRRRTAGAGHRTSTRGGSMSLLEGWSLIRTSARRLRRAPAFSLIVILTLGLGVGANTAVFTVLDAVLLRALPYARPDRLVRVYEVAYEDPGARQFLRAPIVRELRTWDEVFESVGAIYTYREVGADLTDGDAPRRVTVLRASSGYFETLGVVPQLGRTFREEESFGPGEAESTTDLIAATAVLSNALWRDHFGGDPDIVGRTIRLDDAPFEVVGVLPAGFANPFGPQSDVWIPQDLRMGGSNSFGNYYLSVVARLRDGVSIEAARERAIVLSRAFAEREPAAGEQYHSGLYPLQGDVVGDSRARMLWILAAAAALVLLTACLNVANLLLARGLGQDRQLALRSALGSGRGRLVAGILTEYGLLAALGGLAGTVLGWLGLQALLALAPDALPGIADTRMGSSVFLFALSVTAGALAVFGLLPALRMSRTAPADVLRSGDRSATLGRVARRLRDGLVVIQVSAALVLVAGASLLVRSFGALADVPLGFEPQGVLTFEVHLPTARYPDGPSRHAFHETLQERIRVLPGVEAAGAISWLPVNGRYHSWGFQRVTDLDSDADDAPFFGTDVRIIEGDYFEALGIEVLRGARPADVDYEAEPVVWINQTVAAEAFDGMDPLGQQISLNGTRRIVGVIEDIPYGPRGETSRKSYLPHAQYNDDRNWALIQTVRTRGDLASLQEAVREEIARLDGQLVLYRPQSFERGLDAVRAQDRFATVLMGGFAGLALLLSLLGTYGVLAGTVAGRTREFGIRMALGADAGAVRGMVLRYAARITTAGIVLGLVFAWSVRGWLSTLLFDIEPNDPATYAVTVLVFVGVGLLSGWLPARRATRIDTVETLTAE